MSQNKLLYIGLAAVLAVGLVAAWARSPAVPETVPLPDESDDEE